MAFVPKAKIDNIFYLLGLMLVTSVLYILISGMIGVFTREEKQQGLEYLYSILGKIRIDGRRDFSVKTKTD